MRTRRSRGLPSLLSCCSCPRSLRGLLAGLDQRVVSDRRPAGPGAGNAQIRTDLWLFNPDAAANATVTLVFHPAVASGAAGGARGQLGADRPLPARDEILSRRHAVDRPRGRRRLRRARMELERCRDGDRAQVRLERRREPSAGIYGGDAGDGIDAAPARPRRTPSTCSSSSASTRETRTSRPQLDVANTSTVALPIEVRVIQSPSNAILATTSYTIAPKSLLRVGKPVLGTRRSTTRSASRSPCAKDTSIPSGGVLAAATVTDLRTNDAQRRARAAPERRASSARARARPTRTASA